MYEDFTEGACKVIMLAQEEARRFGRVHIDTEQFLLALIAEGSGVASKVLNSLGVNLTKARLKVEQITGFAPGVNKEDDEVITYSPTAERVVVLSSKEALQHGCSNIATEHILLALIQTEKSIAVRVLKELGVEPEQIRAQVANIRN